MAIDLIKVGRGSRKRIKAWAEEIDDPYEPCSLALGGFLVFVLACRCGDREMCVLVELYEVISMFLLPSAEERHGVPSEIGT